MMDFENAATASPPKPRSGEVADHRNPAPSPPPALARGAIEGTLRALLEAEADRFENRHHQDSEAHPDGDEAAPGIRRPLAEADSGAWRTSRARNQPVREAIVERCRQRRGSMEEALLELYHAGLSLHQVGKITEALWGARVDLATVSELAERLAGRIDSWRNRPIKGRHQYVQLGHIELKRRWGGEPVEATVLAATGVNEDGFREVLGVAGAAARDPQAWRQFLSQLKDRGLAGVRLFVGEHESQLADAIAEIYPRAALQSCVWHFNRRVLSEVPFAQLRPVEQMLRAIHASEDRRSAEAKTLQVVGKLEKMGLPAVAGRVKQDIPPTLRYYHFPREHWRVLRTSFSLQRILREVRERTRVVGAFSDPSSAMLLVGARLRWAVGGRRGWHHEVNMGTVF